MIGATVLIVEGLLSSPWNLSRSEQIALFEAAASMIESLQTQLESVQPKWISVEERLPETQDYEGEPIEYIVHVEDAELATFAIFDGERFIPSEFPGFIVNRMFAGPITHWMPLPSCPEEVK